MRPHQQVARFGRFCRAAVVSFAAIAVACDEWPVTNPFDPQFPLRMRIVGPDSIRWADDTTEFSLETEPAWRSDWPQGRVAWSLEGGSSSWGRTDTPSAGTSRFLVVVPGTEPLRRSVLISARLGDREVTKRVTVAPRALTIGPWVCGPTQASIHTVLEVTQRLPLEICLSISEVFGTVVDETSLPGAATATSRDPSVATVTRRTDGIRSRFTLVPVSNGTTVVDVAYAVKDGPTLRASATIVVRLAP